MTPFLLTAQLQQGVVLDTRIGVALDSLLASEIRRRRKEELGVSGQELDGGLSRLDNTVATVELPLAKCINPEDSNQWHWMSTCAQPLGPDMMPIPASSIDVHTIIQSQHISKIEQSVPVLPKNVSDTSGRWRGRRIPVVSTPAFYLAWTGVGDMEEVLSLVKSIQSVGQRRRAGEGSVVSWSAKEYEVSSDEAGHLVLRSSDAGVRQIGRPCFQYCLSALGVASDGVYPATVGMRPPYWHTGTQEEAFLPRREGA